MESESARNPILEVISSLIAIWGEMFMEMIAILPKVFMFLLWLLCGAFILPCVFVAGQLFGPWTEWGEKNF